MFYIMMDDNTVGNAGTLPDAEKAARDTIANEPPMFMYTVHIEDDDGNIVKDYGIING